MIPVVIKFALWAGGAYLVHHVVTKKPVTDAIKQRVVDALSTGDPSKMAKVAGELSTEGYPDQATDLLDTAQYLRDVAQKLHGTKSEPQQKPAELQVARPAKPELPSNSVVTSRPGNAELAQKVAKMLTLKKAGQEDTQLLREFQKAENLKEDKIYGSETALALSKYGIVPVKPRHWGTKAGGFASIRPDKERFRSELLKLAKADPVRAEEWARAAKV